ncbi:MAG: FUSC family protein [Rhodococcus sp. (in: high G+C Gram-positive bacteria)]|uniref:FUSC family protein n=1 Tax=Rhodococcus sp. TaxID=1831 RepID=UPI003BAF829E
MQASPRLSSSPGRFHHTRGALAHSVAPSTWRRAFEVRPVDATTAVALRVGAATAAVLVAGGLLGHQELAGLASLGALTSAFARNEPYPRLARKLAVVGAALIAYVAGGALLGATGVPLGVQVALMAVAAGGAAWILGGFRIVGPGPVILIFAATAAVGYATEVSDLVPAVSAVTLGVVVGWGVAMMPCLFVPLGPARLAVARALAAVSALESDRREASVESARQAVAHARDVIAHSGWHHEAHRQQLADLLADTDTAIERWTHDRDVEQLRVVVEHESALRKIRRRTDIAATGASGVPLPGAESFLRSGLRGMASRPLTADSARVVVAAALSGWVCIAAGFDHPLWASMGAMAAMQGLNFSHTVQRAIQRLLGNVGGAVIAAVLIAAALGYWQTVVVIVVLQTVTELMVVKNYAFASTAVTPMALLLTGLGSAVTADIALSRVADTLVGVVIGVVVAAVTISRADYHHVRARPRP